MRFSVVASTLTGVSALMVPSPRIVKDQVETNEAALEKRVVVEALIMAAATAAVGQVAIRAVDAAIDLVQDLSDCKDTPRAHWPRKSQNVANEAIGTEARESFTQKVTAEMWSKNPSPGTYVAAICYNMDYTFANADHSEVTSVELKSGSLHTEYVKGSELLVTKSSLSGHALTTSQLRLHVHAKGQHFLPSRRRRLHQLQLQQRWLLHSHCR